MPTLSNMAGRADSQPCSTACGKDSYTQISFQAVRKAATAIGVVEESLGHGQLVGKRL